MKLFSACMVLSILTLAGCGNSGNPDAPTSKAPHEKMWVAYHRDDILNVISAVFSNATAAVKPGFLNREHVIQCRACHGENLLGAKGGTAGPACLDCHVLDPVRYPVMCFSCHGYPIVNPQQWYSSNRATRAGLPLNVAFISRVQKDIGAKLPVTHTSIGHKAAPTTSNVVLADDCAVCHGGKDKRGAKHHEIKDPKTNNILNCFLCHVFTFNQPIGSPTFSIPNCSNNIPELTCHPSGNNPI